jgi:predicted ATPase with chaperone activity
LGQTPRDFPSSKSAGELARAGRPTATRSAADHLAAGCTCTLFAKRRYLGRLPGLLSHIEVKTELRPAAAPGEPGETSAAVADRIVLARERAAARFAGTPWWLNSEIPGRELRRRFAPGRDALARVERALQLGQISAATADRVLRVAWTLADLAVSRGPRRSTGRQSTTTADPLSLPFNLGWSSILT